MMGEPGRAVPHAGPGPLHPYGEPRPEPAETVVRFQRVTAGYGGVPALEEVDLEIAAGQFVGVVGPSGSGKTTLLRVMLGTVRPSRGLVTVAGQPVNGRLPRGIGYVPQLETVDWNFPVTVEEVVLMGRWRSAPWVPWVTRGDRERALEILDRLGIADLRRRHIRELSGGQMQRVFLARALASDPHLLLLDEPTSGIDIKTRDEVIHLLHEINHQGVTIVLTTHDLNSVAAHLPWVVCLNRRVVAQGPPADAFTPEALSRTYEADMVVLHHQGMILVAERPHAAHPAYGAGPDGSTPEPP